MPKPSHKKHSKKQSKNAKILKKQKILLKIVNCLYNQYVATHITATEQFLANHTKENYGPMQAELAGIQSMVQKHIPSVLTPSTVGAFQALARIVVWDSKGNASYDGQYDQAISLATVPVTNTAYKNTYYNFETASGAGNLVTGTNYNTRVGSTEIVANKLKQTEFIEETGNHRITSVTGSGPYTYIHQQDLNTPSSDLSITEAAVYGRIGNLQITGIIRLTLEVDQDAFPGATKPHEYKCYESSSSSSD